MIMLDLQKAFDAVDHDTLCQKLSAMGVVSVDWFRSFLSNECLMVDVNSASSDFQRIACRVPQGSILGPLLFLCYVNDMSIRIGGECKLMLYADDSALFYSHRDPRVISGRLGKELESCSKWLVDNKLSQYLGKTESILFGSKRKLKKVKDFSITCNEIIKNQLNILGFCWTRNCLERQ